MRLVLCDDHRLFVEPLATTLSLHGHDVVTTTSPDEAVLAVQSHDPDVAVLDLSFPAGSGLEAGRAIRERFPRTRLMILSASVDPDAAALAVKAGATGFVRKDQAVGFIVRATESVAQGETVIDPALVAAGFRHGQGTTPSPAGLIRYLTPREREVLRRLILAEDTRQIAKSLRIAPSTARTHVQNVLMKLGVHTRLQAVALVAKAGLDGDL